MNYRPLGNSDLHVSSIAFGTWQLGDADYWGDNAQGNDAVRAALDAGINLFDSAAVYGDGESERALGRALGEDRDRALIATKVSEARLRADEVRAACEESLQRLGTDRIDLYQVHWPSNQGVPFSETYGALAALQEEGKIRHIGLSNFGPLNIGDWFETGSAVSDQLGLNLLFRAAEFAVLPECASRGIGVLAYMPLMQSILTGRYRTVEEIPVLRRRTRHFSSERDGTRHGEAGHEDLLMKSVTDLVALADETGIPLADMATAWVLTRPAVTTVIVGANRPDQVGRSVKVAGLALDPDVVARLDEITRPLKDAMGPNLDQWQGEAGRRSR